MKQGGVSADALLRLLRTSIRRGHWRVACRRYLMLRECGAAVPAECQLECESLLQRCSPAQLLHMQMDARSWAATVLQLDARSAIRIEPTAAPMQALDGAAPVRTQWRPLPDWPAQRD
jgi:hypothetical protein